jgi:hypothetical protein
LDLTDRDNQKDTGKLSKDLAGLNGRIKVLEGYLRLGPGFIEKILKARGLDYAGFMPAERILQPDPPTSVNVEVFYHQLHRYSFRLFLRDVVTHRSRFHPEQLTRYCSERVVRKYLHLLIDLGMVLLLGRKSYRLVNLDVHTFGETLEWYVAEIFRREFASPAMWGLQAKGLSSGGDFDVLAEVDHRLVYAETKSSPPRGIHLSNVEAFLQRVQSLTPDIALFFVDTHLRMEDKINVLFQQAKAGFPSEVENIEGLKRGVFRAGKRLFILNSKPNVIENIRVCLRYYFGNLPAIR